MRLSELGCRVNDRKHETPIVWLFSIGRLQCDFERRHYIDVARVCGGRSLDEISARMAKYRVSRGPLQTRKDTKYRIETLYTRDVAL